MEDGMNALSHGNLIAIIAFSCFMVCPRMAAMTNFLTKYSVSSIYLVVIGGTLVSLPLLILTAWTIRQWGLMAGLALAIVTDLLAALVLTTLSVKMAVEVLIIAAFVVAGSRLAAWVTATLL
jgi:hypothetical protein